MTECPPSPCTAVCAIAPDTGVCVGCGRTLAEIAAWGTAGAAGQHAIVAQSATRLQAMRAQVAAKSGADGAAFAR